jgi:hypothetical protein
MRKPPYPVYVSKSKEHSLARFYIRAKKDGCLYDDAGQFLAKNPGNLGGLVDMLLDNGFIHARFTDPEYPM